METEIVFFTDVMFIMFWRRYMSVYGLILVFDNRPVMTPPPHMNQYETDLQQAVQWLIILTAACFISVHLYFSIIPFFSPSFLFGSSLLIPLSSHLYSWITVLSLSLSSCMSLAPSVPWAYLLLDFHKLFKRLFSQTHTWPHCSLIVCPCFGQTHLSPCTRTSHSAVFTHLIWSSL